MLLKLFRTIILIGITLFSARTTRQTQRTVFSVLAFQISGYELLLETKQSVQWISSTAKYTLNETTSFLQDLLWTKKAGGKSEKLYDETPGETMQKTLDRFRSKLVRTAWIVAFVVGIIVRKVLFDIVFGLKTVIVRLKNFINQ
jgi:hypothetical protein